MKIMKIILLMALSLVVLATLFVACAPGETTTIIETKTVETTKTVEVPGPTKTVTVTQTATTPPATNPPTTEPPSVAELTAAGFSHPEMPRITAEQLKLMMDTGLEIGDDFALVDTQASSPTKSYHIWGCTTYISSIEYSSGAPLLSQPVLWSLRNLPKDKLIIFYDHGQRDESAASVAQILLDLNEGYDPENIKVLWQGFNRWRELEYPYYDPLKGPCF